MLFKSDKTLSFRVCFSINIYFENKSNERQRLNSILVKPHVGATDDTDNDYLIVIEDQDYDDYAAVLDEKKIFIQSHLIQ